MCWLKLCLVAFFPNAVHHPSPQMPLLQSEVPARTMDIKLVFYNINWKQAMIAGKKHSTWTTKLQKCIRSIIVHHHADVLCLCEVGTVETPIPAYQMGLMMNSIQQGWSSARGIACEALLWSHTSLYLTVWDSSRCHCSDFNVITQLVGLTIQPW